MSYTSYVGDAPVCARADVPGYSILDGYEWVTDFLKVRDLREKIPGLVAERKKLRRIPDGFHTTLKRAQEAHALYSSVRREQLLAAARMIRAGSTNLTEGFRRNPGDFTQPFLPLIPWEELEAAVKEVTGYEKGLEAADRTRAAEKITAEINAIQDKIEELTPSGFMKNGVDIRGEFVNHWERMQAPCRMAVGPCGLDLDDSPRVERQAYSRLGMTPSRSGRCRTAARLNTKNDDD